LERWCFYFCHPSRRRPSSCDACDAAADRGRARLARRLYATRVFLGDMARGLKKHLKRLNAPKHWMLDKLGGVFAPKPSPGACRAKGFARAGRWATRAPRERAMTRDRDRDRRERYLVDRH